MEFQKKAKTMMQAQTTNRNHPQPAESGEPITIAVDTRFGKITFGQTNIVDFPQGLIGMPESRRFGLSPIPDPRMGQFMILQSLEDLGLSFLVLPLQLGPTTVDHEDAREACAALAIPEADADFFTLVTLRKAEKGISVSVNLRAPIIIDSKSRIARQYVLANPRYPIRQAL
jgi:flagellar assembly factor FliW